MNVPSQEYAGLANDCCRGRRVGVRGPNDEEWVTVYGVQRLRCSQPRSPDLSECCNCVVNHVVAAGGERCKLRAVTCDTLRA